MLFDIIEALTCWSCVVVAVHVFVTLAKGL